MNRSFRILYCLFIIQINAAAQDFAYFDPQLMSFNFNKPLKFRQVYTTSWGAMLFGSSVGLGRLEDNDLEFQVIEPKKSIISKGIPNILNDCFVLFSGIKCIAEGPGRIIFIVSDNNNLGWIDFNKKESVINYPPFNWPGTQHIDIRKIWIDPLGNLHIATSSDTLYSVTAATKVYNENKTINYVVDKNGVVVSGEKKIEKDVLGPNIIPTCFAASEQGDEGFYIGTNRGIFYNNKWKGTIENLFEMANLPPAHITKIETIESNSEIWFSTIGKGMGMSNDGFTSVEYFPYDRDNKRANSILSFTRISDHYFFVGVADSIPAFFNVLNGEYHFIRDTFFKATKNTTTDVAVSPERRMFLIKDEGLYMGGDTLLSKETLANKSGNLIRPTLIGIQVNGKEYRELKNYEGNYDALKTIFLEYYEYKVSIDFVMKGANLKDTVAYEWKLEGYQPEWRRIRFTMLANKFGVIDFDSLKPGKYVFHVRAKINSEQWLETQIKLTIVISAPFWQTWWFWASVSLGLILIVGLILWWRIRIVKKREREKFAHEKQILELEAKALRAQMNPHFIFNSMNSIKSLIQQHEEEKSVTYLTTFSKLIRTLFNNADKKEVSLYDEIETCKYYLQLESMRFDTRFSYDVNVDETIDLKSVQVPALIIQPFIENAIWHGIVPRDSGGHVSLNVGRSDNVIEIVIDDNGIGREASHQNKATGGLTHQSKGVNLTQSRLELNNLLQQRKATMEVIDKKDENGKAAGTKVVIRINEDQ